MNLVDYTVGIINSIFDGTYNGAGGKSPFTDKLQPPFYTAFTPFKRAKSVYYTSPLAYEYKSNIGAFNISQYDDDTVSVHVWRFKIINHSDPKHETKSSQHTIYFSDFSDEINTFKSAMKVCAILTNNSIDSFKWLSYREEPTPTLIGCNNGLS